MMFDSYQKLLPVRFKPLDDELFSSWVIRLAYENGTKLHTFSNLVFEGKRIWNRDIDKCASDWHIIKIANLTGIDSKMIYETCLRSYEGKIYQCHNPNGHSSWILPVGIYHQIRRNYGQQMCSICLREDGDRAYYRKLWRLSWMTICSKHQVQLYDRCPSCSNPITFHRGEMGYRSLYSHYSNIQCPKCNSYWAAEKFADLMKPVSIEALGFQNKLIQSVTDGWITVSGFGNVHTIPFFNGLKQLLLILSTSRRSSEFKEAASLKSGLPPVINSDNIWSFDLLPVSSRYQALCLAGWILDEWPDRFTELAEATATWSSILLSGIQDPPFWYCSVVDQYLTHRTHFTTKEEIYEALSYLKNRHNLLLPSHIEKFIGKSCLFEKRNGLFIASIYEQLKKHNETKEKERRQKIREQAKSIGADLSKTKAKSLSSIFRKQHLKPPCEFLKTQKMLDRLITAYKQYERLNMVKEMEKIGVASIVAKKFDVTPPIIMKWYRRYQQHGESGLSDHSKKPQIFRHQKIFEQEEKWIRNLHSEGLNLREIQVALVQRHNFSISEGGLTRALKRMNLILPNSKKNKKGINRRVIKDSILNH